MSTLRGVVTTMGELFQFLMERRLWWLVPMVVMLLLIGVLIMIGSTAGIGPFIYTLF